MVARRRHVAMFDAGLQGWIVKHSQRNYWRVAAWYELDDLIQDGLLVFAMCKVRYGDRIESRAHLMGLVKMCFTNHVHDLAKRRTRTPEYIISQIAVPGREDDALEYLGGGEEGEAELAVKLSHAPPEIAALLQLMNDPTGLKRLLAPPRYRRGSRHRETNNERLCRVLGFDNYDFEGQFRALLA